MGLIVSFSGSIFSLELDSSFLFSEAVIVHINEVCIRLRELYGL